MKTPDVDVEVKWTPTTIGFGAGLTESVDKTQYYLAVGYGHLLQADSAQNRLGRKCDPPIHFKYGGLVGPSFDSHRLTEWVLETAGWQTQHKLIEELLVAYFEANEDINDHTVLAALAANVGLDKGEAVDMLQSDRYVKQVQDAIAANGKRSSGAPSFFFNQKSVPGVLATDDFVRVFRRISEAPK